MKIWRLYQGALPFLITYCSCVSIQFTIYEYIMQKFRNSANKDDPSYESRETIVNIFASFLGGAVGSALTNSFDVLTVNL